MAEKEVNIFIVDMGRTMSDVTNMRAESKLDWAMRYVWSKLGDMAASGRKTLCAAIVGLRTEDTNNSLQAGEGYEHITVLSETGPVSLDVLRSLQELVAPQTSFDGDAISSIVVAIDIIEKFTKKQKWTRKINLITDAEAPIDEDDIAKIARKIDECNIQLNVLGVDFDDAEYGYKEENKSDMKALNEQILRELVDKTGSGQFATIAEAIDELDIPHAKQTKPYKSYEGTLTLGNPEEFPSSISINVERYFKTHRAAAASASTVAAKGGGGVDEVVELEGGGEQMEGLDFSAVRNARTYKVNDPDALGGKRDVEFESLAKGYEYGRTAVHISESEHNITKLESVKGFTILGFVQRSKYEPFLTMGEVGIIIPRKGDMNSQLALSSLVWALEELDSYAVARIVAKDGKDPIVILLAPCIEPNLEALYDIPLPFAEDVHTYQFPPLDRVVTISGSTPNKHRLLPSDELTEAMSDYVDAMDLATAAGDEEEGEPAEFGQIDDVYNPMIHRLNHAIRNRALYPERPIPDTPRPLLRFVGPPLTLTNRCKHELDALTGAAEVKKAISHKQVPPKAKGKRFREVAKPISGLDVGALLGQAAKTAISRDNSVPEFKHVIAASSEFSEIEDAARQLGNIIRGLVTDSFGDRLYARAVENIGVLRLEIINMEEPELYNRFMKDFKKRILSGELGGDRRDFWLVVKRSRLGLIDKSQSDESTVTEEEASEFYKSR